MTQRPTTASMRPAARWLAIGALGVFFLFMFGTDLIAVMRFHSPVPFSDQGEVLRRYDLLQAGSMSFVDYLFQRQVDHPQVTAFLLGYLDIVWCGGSGALQLVVTTIANLAVVGIVGFAVWADEGLSFTAKVTIGALAVGQVYAPAGAETFLLPFQSTVAVFRFCVVAGFVLLAVAIHARRPWIAASGSGILLVGAILSSGSGLFVVAVTILVIAAARRPNLAWLPATLAVFVLLYSLTYPSLGTAMSAGMIERVAGHLPLLAQETVTLLGYGLTWGLFGEAVDAVVGGVGLAGAAALVIAALRQPTESGTRLLFLALMSFGIIAVLSSVALNINYAPLRGVDLGTVDFRYFFSQRYTVVMTLFWVGLFAMIKTHRRLITSYALAVAISIVAQSYPSAETVKFWDIYRVHRATVAEFTRAGKFEALSDQQIEIGFGLGPGTRDWARRLVEIERKHRFGLFAAK